MNGQDFPQIALKRVAEEFMYVMTIASHKNVKEPDKVYPQPHVYITTHYVCMRAAGWKDIDFDTLMTVSGAGLLFAYDPKDMMSKYSHIWLGLDKRIAEATGFGWEWVKFKDEDEAWNLVKETIDSRRPGKGHSCEDMLFVGYQDAARKEDRKVFIMGDAFPGSGEWCTWEQFEEWVRKFTEFNQNEIGRHTKKVRKAAEKKIALQVLKDAVAWSKTPPDAVKNRFPDTPFGLAAIQAYAEDVADIEGKPQDYFKETAWLGCHAINPQWTARNSTAVYLERLAATKAFSEKVTMHLHAASKEYKSAYADWQEFYRQLGYVAPEYPHVWNMKKNRLAGAAAIRMALQHEQAAINELKNALSLID